MNHIRQLHVGIYFSYTHTKRKKVRRHALVDPASPVPSTLARSVSALFLLFPSPSRCIGIHHVKQRRPFFSLKKRERERQVPFSTSKRDRREIPRTKNPEMRSRGRLCPCSPCHANANAMPYIHDGYLCVRCALGSCPCLSLVARHMVTWDDHSMPTVDHGPRR